MSPPHDDLIQALSSLSVADMQSLIRKLEQRLGFTASPPPRTVPIAVPAFGCPPSPQLVAVYSQSFSLLQRHS